MVLGCSISIFSGEDGAHFTEYVRLLSRKDLEESGLCFLGRRVH